MNILPSHSEAEFPCRPIPLSAGVTPRQKPLVRRHAMKQRGIVLFFALIALVVMSLAAVALIRSVDTNTRIAGNLAFRQSTSSSAEAGLEAAAEWMAATQTAMDTAGLNVFNDAAHTFNVTNAATGYYSNADSALNLTSAATWAAGSSFLVTNADSSGNEVRYIIQRMCLNANQLLSTANCLFSGADVSTGPQGVPLASNICDPTVSPGCPKAGQAAQFRFTARVSGPNNTFSYMQSFVY